MEFYYEAKDKSGKTVSGTRNEPGEPEVLSWIRGNGWVPLNVSQHREISLTVPGDKLADSAAKERSEFWDLSPRIRLRDKLVFFRQLATMMAAGVPMAGVLFPAATVGFVLLPVMLYHQFQLMVCAALAQRYGRRPPDEPAHD